MTDNKAGDTIRIARIRLNLTQNALAIKLGVSANTVCTWENKRQSVPKKHHDKLNGLLCINLPNTNIPERIKAPNIPYPLHPEESPEVLNTLNRHLERQNKYLDFLIMRLRKQVDKDNLPMIDTLLKNCGLDDLTPGGD